MTTDIEKIQSIGTTIFASKDKMLSIIADVRREISTEVFDMDDPKSREACKALAYKVTRSKTAIDGIGKDMVADVKKKIAAVDELRKLARDELSAIATKIRAPLTQWEAEQAAREEEIKSINNLITFLSKPGDQNGNPYTCQQLREHIDALEKLEFKPEVWKDELNNVTAQRDFAINQARQHFEARQQYEKDQAELEDLRREKAEREQAEAEAAAGQALDQHRERVEKLVEGDKTEEPGKANLDAAPVDERQECIDRAAVFFNDVMPQIGGLVIQDFENVNQLAGLLARFSSQRGTTY